MLGVNALSGGGFRLPSSFVNTITDLAPLHWWRMTETSGATVADTGSSPINGTCVGTYTRNYASLIPSETDPAIDLPDGYVNCSTAARFTTEAFSLVCAVRIDSFSAPYANPVLFFTGRYLGMGYYWQVVNTAEASPYLSFATNQTDASQFTDSAVGSIALNTTYLLITTRSGATVKHYIQGVEASYRAVGTHADPLVTTDATAIGGYRPEAISNKLDGKQDEMIVFNYALTAAQAAQIFESTGL